MDYEKKYKELVAKIKNAHLYAQTDSTKNVLEGILPELAESEDERILEIIKHCIESRYLHTSTIKGISQKQCFAWLEKQGEPQDKGEISDGYHTFNELYYYRMLYNAAFFNMLPKEWVHKSKKHHDGEDCFGGGWFIVMANLPTGQISNHYELKDWDLFQIPEKEVADKWDGHTPQEAADRLHKYLLEKQGEQNIADKIKPKFHEGDWITNGDYTWKIIEVKPLDYILKAQDGNIVDDTISHVDEQFHSFTVKDAKDGDVLCTYECGTPKIVFILKGTPKKYYALGYHCYYNIMYPHFGPDSEKGCLAPNDEDVKPATKEQRDTLERAITNAGYTFNFEKKELKKIKQKPQRMVSAEAKESLYDKPTDEEMKELLRTEYEKGRADTIAEMEKDWSEEADVMINKLLAVVKLYYDRSGDDLDKQSCISFLKSLKDKVQPQPKQEWSEEDEIARKALINLVEMYYGGCIDKTEKKRLLNLLKSLRPQNTWKPSEEQMSTLNLIISDYYHACTKECDKKAIVLKSILEQLKQL